MLDKKAWLNHLKDLSIEELRQYIKTLHQLLDVKVKHKGALIMLDLEVGDEVEFLGRRGATLTGKVTKLNKTTVCVTVKRPGALPDHHWRVAASLCKKVG